MAESQEIQRELTAEEKAKAWDLYVYGEVKALLDIYIPAAKGGSVGIKYRHPVTKKNPGYDEWDESKAESVQISIILDFEELIDVSTNKK